MESKRLLLVEDDERLGSLVAEYLTTAGFQVAVERNGIRAKSRILEEHPDIVILDVMLPGEDGLSICRSVRQEYGGIILMMTARGDELDQVLGLELGADDYVAKPVSPRLLLARVKALMRRAGPRADSEQIVDGELHIDRSRREIRVADRRMELTTAEFDLLWYLARHAGRPVTRQDLFQELRGIDYDGVDRSMDVRVSQLRKKLEMFAGRAVIKTVRGVGYQYARPLA